MITLRYIFVHLVNDFSGSPRILADFCASERIKAADPVVVTNHSRGFLNRDLGRLSYVWYPEFDSKPLKYFFYIFAQIQIFLKVLGFCLKIKWAGEKPVVVNNTTLCLSSVLASWLMGGVTIVYVHELIARPLFYREAVRCAVSLMADEVLLVSNFLLQQYGFKNSRTRVLSNGLRANFRLSEGIDQDSKFEKGSILFVGSLKPYKGIYEFVELAKRMPEFSFEAVLNCSERNLMNFRRIVSIPDNLFLQRQSSDLEQRLKNAFVVVNMSITELVQEGFALTVLEGMAAGCPVIVPTRGGHFDFFNEAAGYALDAECTDEIVAVITKLRADKKRWTLCSDAAMEITKSFTSEKFLQLVDDFLDDLEERYSRGTGESGCH